MRVLLFSGGLDSTALAFWLGPDRLLFLDYGQIPAAGEQRAATQIAKDLGLPLDILAVNCRDCGSGDMAGRPSNHAEASEYWPYRNQLLITLAAMKYATESDLELLIGTVASDTIHADGRPEFLAAMRHLLRTQADVRLEAPAASMTAVQLQEIAEVPLRTLAWAFSCHRSDQACGQCRGCTKHFQTLTGLTEGIRHEVNS